MNISAKRVLWSEKINRCVYTTTSAIISWTPLSSDGGSPIKQYIVEKKMSTRSTWMQVTRTRTTTVTVSELNEDTSYDFRVRAETDYGEGENAEITDIKTKTVEVKKEVRVTETKKEEGQTAIKPTVTISKSTIAVGTNQMMQVDVTFTGQPRPQLTWIHNGTVLEMSRRVTVEERRYEKNEYSRRLISRFYVILVISEHKWWRLLPSRKPKMRTVGRTQ